MADLEKLVRPFVAPAAHKGGKTYKPEPIELGTTVWTFGGGGDDVFSLRASNQNEIENTESQEIVRKYDLVKVMDPNNSDNYVEQEVLKEYEARNVINDSRIKIRFKEQEASSNVEILKRDLTRKNT